MASFKVAIFGESGLGKTVYVNSLRGYDVNCLPTLDVSVNEITFRYISHKCHDSDTITFTVWDIGGFRGSADGSFEGCSAGIYVAPVVTGTWFEEFLETCGDVPVVCLERICKNDIDPFQTLSRVLLKDDSITLLSS